MLQQYSSIEKQEMFVNNFIELMHINSTVSTNIIRKTQFNVFMNGKSYQDIICLLFENCIIFKLKIGDQYQHYRLKFAFSLLFELQYQTNNPKLIHTIKLYKDGHQLSISTQKNFKQMILWKQFFEKTLNQKGFHHLFKAIKKIGKGGFASVYLVQKIQDQKRYAVKAFSKQSLYAEDKGRQSLINQIEIMKKLSHKNLMKLYGVYQTQHSVYLVLQLLEGGLLQQRIKKQIKPTQFECKIIMKGILQGLQAMHKKDIMHRDLKPQNIIFRRQNDCNCVLADFGLAQVASNQQYLYVRCGTPGFVAPQIVNIKDQKTRYTCACDIFSAGIIFHILLLKQSPFPAKQQNEALRQNRACILNYQAQQYLQLPQISLDLLQKMLQKDPNKRISAKDALKHPYFHNQFVCWDNTKKNNLIKIQAKYLKEDCNRNSLNFQFGVKTIEKRLNPLRQDSCLKLKMKEATIKKGEKLSDSSSSIHSPELPNIRRGGRVLSRFNKLTNGN